MNRSPSRPSEKKKPVSPWVRVLRFLFGKTFRLILLCCLLTAAVALIGFWIYAAVCEKTATWADITAPADETIPEIVPPVPYEGTFAADMTAYEPYINPIGEYRDAFLTKVGRSDPLPADAEPEDLTVLAPSDTRNENELRLSLFAAKALEAMLTEMRAQEIPMTDSAKQPLRIVAAYRSYEQQLQLFSAEVDRLLRRDETLTASMAEDIASSSVSPPGTDEHQTGLAVDFAFGAASNSSFAATEACAWLSENAWKFGFILRYPADKTDVTGVPSRPWQFRYVGRAHAALMREYRLCLEEYLEVVILD